MKNLNLKKISMLMLMISAVLMSSYANSSASDNKGIVIKGKVVYSDDNSPVSGGYIKVVLNSVSNSGEAVLENAVINSNGEFNLLNIIPGLGDRIKIMCYPNDREDNIAFTPVIVDYNSLFSNDNANSEIVIRVERIKIKSDTD